MIDIEYVSLHNHTSFSIMEALVKPNDLFKRTKELGQKAVAVTDHGTLAGMWDCLKASKKHGVKLIAGCEFYFVSNVKNDDEPLRHIILLAKNAKGYRNLLKLNKLGYDNYVVAFKKAFPRIDWNLLESHSDGLICTTACGNGIIAQRIMQKNFDDAKKESEKLKDIFGDDLAFELQGHSLTRKATPYSGQVDQKFINLKLKEIAQELNIRCIVTTDAHYLEKNHHRAHDTLLAVGSKQPVYSGQRLTYNVQDFYVKNAIEVAQHFVRLKAAYGEDFIQSLFENTIYFADKCEEPDWIDPKYTNPSGKELPEFPVKHQPDYEEFIKWKNKNASNLDEDVAYLRYWCDKEFENKVPVGKEDEYRERLNEEFGVIEYHGFSSYMLIVADYIEYARKNGIRVGQGRGCNFFGTQVLTKYGFKNLGEINAGDCVFTHTGELKLVTEKFKYNCKDEKCLKINGMYFYKHLIMTKDHKVFAVKYTETEEYKKALPKWKHKCKRFRKVTDAPEWIKAEDLDIGDLIFTRFPIRKSTIVPAKIDLARFAKFRWFDVKLSKNHISYKYNSNTIKIKRYFIWDEDSAYFLGRFVGDGWFSSGKKDYYSSTFGIAFHRDDTEGIDRICKFLNKNGYIYRFKRFDTKCVQIIVTNKIIVQFLRYLFPNYKQKAYTKTLPVCFRYMTKKLLLSLLQGLIDSDGSIEKTRECIDTTSFQLALEIKEALLYLKIPSSITVRKSYKTAIKGKNYLCRESYKVRFAGINTNSNDKFIRKLGYFSKISSIEEVNCHDVYDISVKDDRSYLTTNGVVHNSVGGSLIGYLLNIHSADPIRYKLIFARFHNKEKTSFPDVDTDFAPSGRNKVQDYIRRKYGEDYVAHVSNVNTITPKVYVRDIARTFEFGDIGRSESAKIGDNIADSIPSDVHTLNQALDGEKAPLFCEWAEQYPELKEFADTVAGQARAWSTHAGGLIIGRRPLAEIVPLRRDVHGNVSIEYDKDRAEENGLVKMDTLGLETLDIIDHTYDLVKKQGKPEPPDPPNFEEYDKDTYDLISRGDTFCVFQLGGIATGVCKLVKPKSIEEISYINALVRPSAKAIVSDFIATRDGRKEVELMHPLLQRAFGDTYGFGLYEECLLYLAQDVAGWDLHSADRLRKLTKEKGKNPKKVAKWREEFIDDSVNRVGLEKEMAENIWDNVVAGFSGYGFNLSLYFLELVDIYNHMGQFITSKPIKDVKSGEFVRSRDEQTGEDIFIEVIDNHDHGELEVVEVELDTGEKISCTMNHKFRTKETGEMLPLHEIIENGYSIVVG